MIPRHPCGVCFQRPDIGGACPSCAPADTPDGFDRAPTRYTAKGRETIDRMRDLAHAAAREFFGNAAFTEEDVADLADLLFAYHCDATALKYEDREGLKDDPTKDRSKRAWYLRMAAHVRGECPNPRSERPGFVAYERPAVS